MVFDAMPRLRPSDPSRRVVITGIGLVSPVGNDTATAWKNLVGGVSGIDEIAGFDASGYTHRFAGEVRGFNATDWLNMKVARRTDRASHMGVAVARQALDDSGISVCPDNCEDIGLLFGSVACGQGLLAEVFDGWRTKGPRSVGPFATANSLSDAVAGIISIELGLRGYNISPTCACATGTVVVGEAVEAIRRGDCCAALAGSSEAPVLEHGQVGFENMRGLGLPRPGEGPESACRPFDATRDGFILGEGGVCFMLEEVGDAVARGADIIAEVVGYGVCSDGFDQVFPSVGGEGSARAMRIALARAGVRPDQIGLIHAHGTGTPVGDVRESQAIHTVFGDATPKVAITATKSMTGHMMSPAGGVGVATAALALRDQVVPGIPTYRDPDPDCDLNISAETRPASFDYALANSLGLGGRNAALILKRWNGQA